MSTYVVPALDDVDFALTSFTPGDVGNHGSALSSYTAPALDSIDFALTAYTLPSFIAIDFEIGDTLGGGDIALAGAAVAGVAAEGVLHVGVDLAGEAVAGATADGALEIGIELAGDAVASAQADAALTVEGDEPPPAEGWVAGGAAAWVHWYRPKTNAAIVRRHRRRDDDVIAALTH
jgi:hypothetical protein